jgi:DNA polymerase-3 subunit epsilon
MRQIVLDTETTGLRPSEGHRVIEIAAIEIVDYLPTGNTYQQYINPQRDVPEASFKVHGLSYEFLKDQPLFENVINKFLEFVGNDPIIAHNVDFDVGFLNYELNTCGKESLKNEKIDTVSIAREKFPGQSVSLDALCKRFAIDNTQREKHSATVDTELLARVYIELMDARELSLDLNNSVEVKNSPVTFNTEKIKNRNLPSRLSEKEKELHQSFIQTLGKNSIWNKISQSSE